MKGLLVIFLMIVALGCSEREAVDAKLNASVAFVSAREAMATTWNAMAREASKLTAESSREALKSARDNAIKLRDEVSRLDVKNPLDSARLEAAKLQLEKIQAAMDLQKLREQSESAVRQAVENGKIVQAKYEDASAQLAKINQDYRDLKVRLDAAQKVYDQASSALAPAIEKIRELGGN